MTFFGSLFKLILKIAVVIGGAALVVSGLNMMREHDNYRYLISEDFED